MARREPPRALQHGFTSQVGHLSIWSVGRLTTDTACIKINVDPFQLDLPFNLRVLRRVALGISVTNLTITEPTSLIPGLPPNVPVSFEVTPLNTDRVILRVPKDGSFMLSGPNVSPSPPPFPYLACQAVDLTANLLPAKEWLNRIPGNEATASAYYDSIGARPAKDTFAKWRSLNGFTAADNQNEAVFYNPRSHPTRSAHARHRGQTGIDSPARLAKLACPCPETHDA